MRLQVGNWSVVLEGDEANAKYRSGKKPIDI